MKSGFKSIVLAAGLLAGLSGAALAGSLKIESWRNDDADIWKNKIIPAFNAKYPDIQVEFAPTPPKDYNASLNARLEGGTAGRSHHLPTLRRFARPLQQGSSRRPQRPQGHGGIFRGGQERLDHR